VLGLLVNGVCVLILGVRDHDHSHVEHDHSHHHGHHHDHNLKAAYLHVLADALTSILAIVALLTAKYFGFIWMDSAMGIVGAVLVAQWSVVLLRSTSRVLLDQEGPHNLRRTIRQSIEADDDTVLTDLHVWAIGPKIYSAIISVVAHEPLTPAQYKACIPKNMGLVHVTVEVHACPESAERLQLAG